MSCWPVTHIMKLTTKAVLSCMFLVKYVNVVFDLCRWVGDFRCSKWNFIEEVKIAMKLNARVFTLSDVLDRGWHCAEKIVTLRWDVVQLASNYWTLLLLIDHLYVGKPFECDRRNGRCLLCTTCHMHPARCGDRVHLASRKRWGKKKWSETRAHLSRQIVGFSWTTSVYRSVSSRAT